MSTDGGRSLPRRPARYGPDALEAHGGTLPGPAEITEVAHQTAAILVGTGRAANDPEVTTRLVTLVDDLGLSTVADLWSARPARSLPGALWRLYALREWVRRSPEQASREYAAGIRFTDVAHAVAGIAEPPRPEELQRVADQILAGVFEGDLAWPWNAQRPSARSSPRGAPSSPTTAMPWTPAPRATSPAPRRPCSPRVRTCGPAPTCGAPASSTERIGLLARISAREHIRRGQALGSSVGAGPRQPRVPTSAATSGHAP